MANPIGNVIGPKPTRIWRVAQYSLLALLTTLLPASICAQEKLPLPPADIEAGASRGVSIVTLGTTKAKVDSLLGTPRMGWTINCLCRSMFTYPDGTKIIFVDERVISASPNGLAEGSPATGYVVEHEGRKVLFEPMILRGVPMDGPIGEVKRAAEECFFMAPSVVVIPPPPPFVPVPNYISLRRILGLKGHQ